MYIQTESKIFRLRNILNTISDTSYAYKMLYNKYRLESLNQSQAEQLIKAYEELIAQVKNSIQNTENEIPPV